MRSPWVDLLFLHHHVTPMKPAWRANAPAHDGKPERLEVDVNQLPLQAGARNAPNCCA